MGNPRRRRSAPQRDGPAQHAGRARSRPRAQETGWHLGCRKRLRTIARCRTQPACPMPVILRATRRRSVTRRMTARPAKPWATCPPRSGRRDAAAASRRPRPGSGCRPCLIAPNPRCGPVALKSRSELHGPRWPTGRDAQTTPACAPLPPWQAWPWGCAPPDGRRRQAQGSAGEAPVSRQHPHMARMRTSCRVSAALRAHHLDRWRRLKARCQRSSKA